MTAKSCIFIYRCRRDQVECVYSPKKKTGPVRRRSSGLGPTGSISGSGSAGDTGGPGGGGPGGGADGNMSGNDSSPASIARAGPPPPPTLSGRAVGGLAAAALPASRLSGSRGGGGVLGGGVGGGGVGAGGGMSTAVGSGQFAGVVGAGAGLALQRGIAAAFLEVCRLVAWLMSGSFARTMWLGLPFLLGAILTWPLKVGSLRMSILMARERSDCSFLSSFFSS